MKYLRIFTFFVLFFISFNISSIGIPHKNNITIRSDRVFMLNGQPFFPIAVNCEFGEWNYRCQLRKSNGKPIGFNTINLQTQVSYFTNCWLNFNFCQPPVNIMNIISGDLNSGSQYQQLLGPMGWNTDYISNANRIFNYLDDDMYVLADDYLFYPSTVDWFEQNSGCTYPGACTDCANINPRFDQLVRNQSVDRVDALAKQTNSKLIGFYGLDDANMMHTRNVAHSASLYFNNINQQIADFQTTYNYIKSKYPNSIIVQSIDPVFYPRVFNDGSCNFCNDFNLVRDRWVQDAIGVASASDVILSVDYNFESPPSGIWDPNWRMYEGNGGPMWYPNHLEQTLFPRVINTFDTPKALMAGITFDFGQFCPQQPSLDAKVKWMTYIGLQKGATALEFFGWNLGNTPVWESVKLLVDTLVNVKHLTQTVFTKSNRGPVGYNITGYQSSNVSYTVYAENNSWLDYYILATNNPNGLLNGTPESDNTIAFTNYLHPFYNYEITEMFSGNVINPQLYRFYYTLPWYGTSLFHVKYLGSDNSIEKIKSEHELPTRFYLEQNYPNPFNPITEITFGLPTDEFVTIEIFNSIGQKISILMNEVKTAGVYHIPFDGLKYASGMYIYKFKAGSFIETKKMLLVK